MKKTKLCYDPNMVVRELPGGLVLIRDGQGLGLSDGSMIVRGDFAKLLPRIRKENLSGELLVRAGARRDARSGEGPLAAEIAALSAAAGTAGLPAAAEAARLPLAVDATAGLGEDSFLLAAAGWRVILYEHNPVIAELLSDALARAAALPETAEIASRMTLLEEESTEALRKLPEAPDLVFLDPMFPERKKSGLVGKKLQLMQKLEIPCPAEEALLSAAYAAGPRRIVVKRPLKGPYLGGVKPSFSLKGKAIRYDILIP